MARNSKRSGLRSASIRNKKGASSRSVTGIQLSAKATKTHQESRPTRVRLLKKMLEKSDDSLGNAINEQAIKKYSAPAKTLQIRTVVNLARGRNVFLLAGTGYGKSRIPELYYNLIPKETNAVVLVLNPLDALGDNQVLEKTRAGFTAINLTKKTFNPEEAEKIAAGGYNFVYLSPEIFLNSKLFGKIYYSTEFQNRLALVVVDEAHLIYHWGMVKSARGKKKRSSALGKHEDRGIFRPSYGNLGGRLLARNAAPILLMSATCSPVAISAIKWNLKLDSSNLILLKGELTRPEIRIIRVVMKGSLTSCTDLLDLYPPASQTPNALLVPTLVYCPTRMKTGKVLEVLGVARGTPAEARNPRSTFARRYHSCTGNRDKIDVVQDFGDGVFPVISCTMALGLGQNWTRVRSVVTLGRGDPSAVCQMIGRCGRDGKPGLALMFVEKNRIGGKNQLLQFTPGQPQTDDDRMDALAVTPVCLRIAFAIDNSLGYIPLSVDDPSYIKEMEREKLEGFATCRCSNCQENQAQALMDQIQDMNIDNIVNMIVNDLDVSEVPAKKKNPVTRPRVLNHPMEASLAKNFRDLLVDEATCWIESKISARSFIRPGDIFGTAEAELIVGSLSIITSESDVRRLAGGHFIEGLVGHLHNIITNFKSGPIYTSHMQNVQYIEEDKYIMKTALKHLNENQKKRKAELKETLANEKSKKISPSD
ncbi:ATP-dependent DNA helicase sgs1 [Puccinia graminis f. sp. tritici]|uniref:DNA 3'-5' helicase n=1 Tax=Puccinia graminis f. sp. tritici TaxID=56615 RepID=A0A5B0QXT9_PUCGR|nr:ATP-dependent DNA helicase sgs1 [Puccinia graminis f. sp. tritici]